MKKTWILLWVVTIIGVYFVILHDRSKEERIVAELNDYKASYHELVDDKRELEYIIDALEKENEDLLKAEADYLHVFWQLLANSKHEDDFIRSAYFSQMYFEDKGQLNLVPSSGSVFTDSDSLTFYFELIPPKTVKNEALNAVLQKFYLKRMEAFIYSKYADVEVSENLVKVTLDLEAYEEQYIYLSHGLAQFYPDEASSISVKRVDLEAYHQGRDYFTRKDDLELLKENEEWVLTGNHLSIYINRVRERSLYIDGSVFEYDPGAQKQEKRILPHYCIEGMRWHASESMYEIIDTAYPLVIDEETYECLIVKEISDNSVKYHYYAIGRGEIHVQYKGFEG